MGISSYLWILSASVALCISCCQTEDVLEVKSLTTVTFDHLDTPYVEYICMGALEINFVDENELLLGVCTPTKEHLSAAIGTLAISELEKTKTTGANLLYGSLIKTKPAGSDPNWDGIGVNARIKRPEQFYQTKYAIRFIDDRSCARMINRATGKVTTVLGKCATNTLDIRDAVLSACYGMTYFEDKEMWVFSVVNDGLYVYKEGDGSPRLILKQDQLSSVISTSSRQLQRDLDYYGKRSNYVWNKIKSGINLYDFTDITSESGNLTYQENFFRYISATGRSPIDTTAVRHNETDPAMGSSDADISVSPNGQVLAIGDISLRRLFFLDITNPRQIKPLQAVCVKKSGIIENRLNNCTFSAISAAGWVNPSTFVTYEKKFGVFRKFTVTSQKPLPIPDTSNCLGFPGSCIIPVYLIIIIIITVVYADFSIAIIECFIRFRWRHCQCCRPSINSDAAIELSECGPKKSAETNSWLGKDQKPGYQSCRPETPNCISTCDCLMPCSHCWHPKIVHVVTSECQLRCRLLVIFTLLPLIIFLIIILCLICKNNSNIKQKKDRNRKMREKYRRPPVVTVSRVDEKTNTINENDPPSDESGNTKTSGGGKSTDDPGVTTVSDVGGKTKTIKENDPPSDEPGNTKTSGGGKSTDDPGVTTVSDVGGKTKTVKENDPLSDEPGNTKTPGGSKPTGEPEVTTDSSSTRGGR